MNVMFVFNGSTIVTSPLTGTILPGITRRTIIEMAPELGYEVEERPISIEEVATSVRQGKITEMFGCGTAAVVTPIGTIADRGEEFSVHSDEPGPVTRRLYEAITGVQYGTAEDRHSWMKIVG
jgi:branched-chain amino acid aminotransferase